MIAKEYNTLSLDDQLNLVISQGRFIEIVIRPGLKSVYFSFREFFAEVNWSAEIDEIVSITGYETEDYLSVTKC